MNRSMRHACYLLLGFLLSAPNFAKGEYRYYAYTDLTLDDAPSELIIEPEKNRVRVGHAFRSAEFCEDPNFYCVESRAIAFKVPRSGLSLGQTWTSSLGSYRVSSETSLRMLGVKIDVFLVSRVDDGAIFYYSARTGLVAFSIKNSMGGRDFFVSDSKPAFLAAP